jgi:hypothetical protein
MADNVLNPIHLPFQSITVNSQPEQNVVDGELGHA